jgi:hypothetical protein
LGERGPGGVVWSADAGGPRAVTTAVANVRKATDDERMRMAGSLPPRILFPVEALYDYRLELESPINGSNRRWKQWRLIASIASL